MKTITGKSLFNKVNKIFTKEDNFTDLLKRTTFEDISSSNDLSISEIEGEDTLGWWAWTSGGIKISFWIYVRFLLGSGFFNSQTEIGKWIMEKDEVANKHAKEELGSERTDENEDDYYELVDDYLSDITLDFDIRFVVLNPNDRNYNEKIGNGKTYVMADFAINDNFDSDNDRYCTDLNKLNQFISQTMKEYAEKFNELV